MLKKILKSRKLKSFTLLEMVIVVSIIAMLTLLIIPNVVSQRDRAESRSDKAFIQTIQTQVELVDNPADKASFETLHTKKYITDDQYQKLTEGNYSYHDGIVSKATAK